MDLIECRFRYYCSFSHKFVSKTISPTNSSVLILGFNFPEERFYRWNNARVLNNRHELFKTLIHRWSSQFTSSRLLVVIPRARWSFLWLNNSLNLNRPSNKSSLIGQILLITPMLTVFFLSSPTYMYYWEKSTHFLFTFHIIKFHLFVNSF